MLRPPVLLALLSISCAATVRDANLPAGVDRWPALTKLAYLPVRVHVDVDRAPITPDSQVRVQQSVQQSLERAVNREVFDTRAILALAEPWQRSHAALGHWLEANPCLGSSGPADAQLSALLPPVRAEAAVFIEVHAHLTRDGVASGHTNLGKLTGAIGVATLANVVALHAAGSGQRILELAVDNTAVQLVARDLELRRYGPLCADYVDVTLRDTPELRLLGDATVTVAVIDVHNQLLWFRRGTLPLVVGDPARAAQVIASFVRAGS